MQCAVAPLRALPARTGLRVRGRARSSPTTARAAAHGGPGAVSASREPSHARRLEVRVLRRLPAHACSTARTSCSTWRATVDIAYFLEASLGHRRGPLRPLARRGLDHDRRRRRRGSGSVRAGLAPAGDHRCVRDCRRHPGPAQLRRRRGVPRRRLRARPTYISTLETSTPISAHVPVDFELQGCPIDRASCSRCIGAFLHGRRPDDRRARACASSASAAGNVCVMVARGTPCLGPVTHAGCGALCPSYDRGCYGCFGPMESPNTGVAGGMAAGPRRRAP